MENIVRIIDVVRAGNSLTRGRLTKGICSASLLLRAEVDERVMDKLMLDSLMQRLGRSVRGFEFMLGAEDYDAYLLRAGVRRNILEGHFEEAESVIQSYLEAHRGQGGADRLHRQIMLLMKSYILDKRQEDPEVQKSLILKAIRLTMPTFSPETAYNLYYGEVEMLLTFRLGYLYMGAGQEKEALACWEALYGLLKRPTHQEGELVHVFAVIAYHLSKYYYSKGRYEEVYAICTRILGYMRDKNKILYAAELMELGAKSHLHIKDVKLTEEEITPGLLEELLMYRHSVVLKGFIRDNYPEWNADTEYPMYYEYGILSDGRTIRQRRQVLGISQEKMILTKDNHSREVQICTVDTISRLENRRYSTQKKILRDLLRRLNLPQERCFSDIFVEDYNVKLELDRIDMLMGTDREEEGYARLQEVKKKLDMDCNVNRQGVELMEYSYERKIKNLTPEQRYHRLIEMLEYTLPWSRREKYRDCYLFDNENWIVCLFAGCLAEMGKREDAEALYRDVLAGLEQYMAEGEGVVHHYAGILRRWESRIANEGRLEEADRLIEYALPLTLRHNIAGAQGGWIYDKAWNMEQRGLDEEGMAQYRRYVRQSYVISCLRGQTRKEFLEKRCGERYPRENILEGLLEE